MRNTVFLLVLFGIIGLLVLGEILVRQRASRPVGSWPMRPLPALDPKATRIVVLADSIAFGDGLPEEEAWPSLVAAQLGQSYPDRRWQVVNAGVPGDNAVDAYVRYVPHVAAYRPHLLLIALGINDGLGGQNELTNRRLARFAANEQTWWGRSYLLRALAARWQALTVSTPDPSAPQVPPEQFQTVLTWLVREGQKQGAGVALLTLTPIDVLAYGDSSIYAARWREYSGLVRDTARKLGVPVIEVGHRLPDDAWQADGLHLTAAGEAIIAGRVWQALRRPALASDLHLPMGESNAEMAPSLE